MSIDLKRYKCWASSPQRSGFESDEEELQKTEGGRKILEFRRRYAEEQEQIRNWHIILQMDGYIDEAFISSMLSDPEMVDWLQLRDDVRPPKPYLRPEVVAKLEARLLERTLLEWHINRLSSRNQEDDAVEAEQPTNGKKRKRRKGGPK